jgi:hypothetical protein
MRRRARVGARRLDETIAAARGEFLPLVDQFATDGRDLA